MTSKRDRAGELLSDYRERTLDAARAAELEAYLASDEECRQLLAALEDVADAMPRLQAVSPPAGLAQRAAHAALAAVARQRPRVVVLRQPALPPLLQAAAAMAMVVTGVAGLVSGPETGPSHVATRVVERTSLELRQRTDRLVENVRAFGLGLGAAVSNRVDGISDWVEDYRDLLEEGDASLPVEGRGDTPHDRVAKDTQLREPNAAALRYHWMKAGAGNAAHADTSSLSAWRKA